VKVVRGKKAGRGARLKRRRHYEIGARRSLPWDG